MTVAVPLVHDEKLRSKSVEGARVDEVTEVALNHNPDQDCLVA